MTYSSQLLDKVNKSSGISNIPNQNSSGLKTSNSANLLQSLSSGTYKTTPYKPVSAPQPQAAVNMVMKQSPLQKAVGFATDLKNAFVAGGIQAKAGVEATAGMVLDQITPWLNSYDVKMLEDAKKNKSTALVKYLENKIDKQTQFLKPLSDTATKIKEKSVVTTKESKDYAEKNVPMNNPKNFWEAVKDPKWIALQVAQNTPSLLSGLGLGVATTAITKNPAAGLAVGYTSSFAQNSGSVYLDAKQYGLDDKKAQNVGIIAGAVMALFDSLPMERIISRTPQGEMIKKKILKEVTQSVIKQGTLEASTESIQQIVQNVAAWTYDKYQNIFEGVPESALIGGIMGSGTGAVGDVVTAKTSKPIASVATGKNVVNEAKAPDQISYKYEPAKDLSPEARVIEAKFGKEIESNPDKMMSDYVSKFGNVLNTDNVREFSTDYVANRSLNSAAVHEPSSSFTKYMYQKMLQAPDPTGEDLVTFTGGGTGAGKTTSIQNVKAIKELVESSQIVYDNNMNRLDSSIEKIDLALKNKKRAQIVFVYADPVEAFKQAVSRANRIGRTVPMKNHLDTHVGSYEVIFKLAEHYKDNPDVDIRVIDNSLGKGKAKEVPLDNIKDKTYDKVEIERQANDILKEYYREKKISADIYKGFSGKEADAIEGVGGSDSQGNGRESKQTGNEESLALEPSWVTPKEIIKNGSVDIDKLIESKQVSPYTDNKGIDAYVKRIENGESIDVKFIMHSNGDISDGNHRLVALYKLDRGKVKVREIPRSEFNPKYFHNSSLEADETAFEVITKTPENSVKTTKPAQAIKLTLYRGGVELNDKNISESGVSFSTSKKVAEEFYKNKGGKVNSYYVDGNAKIINFDDIPGIDPYLKSINSDTYGMDIDNENRKNIYRKLETEYVKALKYAKKNGYDGVKFNLEGEIRLVNLEKVKQNLGQIKNVSKVKQTEVVASNNVPVGEGKQRNSRLQERIQKQLLEIDAAKYDWDEKTGKYNRMSLETNAKEAIKYLEDKPQDAIKVAYGMKSAPEGITANGVSLAVAFKAREEGNYQVFTDVINRLTLRATRQGQEIVTLKGQFNQNTPENFVRQVLARRLNTLGKSVVTEAKEMVGKMNLAREKALVKIDREAERVNRIVSKQKSKIQLAQDIIEALKCK